ncbi:hypothetical protein SISNIDRAFT_458134 [Sistotremastrum niveocremeum HHB9708]|uniref:Uncharacterized protein n=1 Tax=Sistotremastrum niveocremeum HHB9708 TaxID=1314777 RepID=A0A164R2I1_9AGAM|nr:hypothetical protein SISNIDRAFT_458134 [Sistotremastrum niveocremeum HHB9708]
MKEDETGKLLEGKVAQAASKKCSFEEVSALHDEVRDWLNLTPGKLDPEHPSVRALKLGADLLRAILSNGLAYAESSKVAKDTEFSLRGQLDMYKAANEKMENELKKWRTLYTQKTRECQQLRSELDRYLNRSQEGPSHMRTNSATAFLQSIPSLGLSSSAPLNVPTMYETVTRTRAQAANGYPTTGVSPTSVAFPRRNSGAAYGPSSPTQGAPFPDRRPTATSNARQPSSPLPVPSKPSSQNRSATPDPSSAWRSTSAPFQRSASAAGFRPTAQHQIWRPPADVVNSPAVAPPPSVMANGPRFLSVASKSAKHS